MPAHSRQLRLLELVHLIKAHFAPLKARVHFPGDYSRLDNIKVVDATDVVRTHLHQASDPTVDTFLGELLFGIPQEVLMEISDPQPDPAAEDAFYWELVTRFEIPPELEVEDWLSHPAGRRAWGEWTTWHDHTRIATCWLADR
ncbi:MAG: hypothetical protein GEEBNDBF_00369 [bacterium]|nr:hypothetical protein [bacterium]